jgi:uncharacterized protein
MPRASFHPPDDVAALYRGQVMHARMKPKAHRFTYGVYTLLIDIDRLKEAHNRSRLFSVGHWNMLSFDPADHGDGGRTPLGSHVRGLLATAGLAETAERILLLCYPRVLGFVFNPISVYYAYGAEGGLIGVVYEVRNTFGDMHTYVAPVRDGELTESGLRQERDKLFHVSPFMDMPMRYHFRLRPPADDVALRILETDGEGPILSATFIGKHTPLTAGGILTAFCRIPLLTVKVVAGIHYEAIKLWLKGIRFFSRPEPPPAASVSGRFLGTPSHLTPAQLTPVASQGGRE